MPCLMDHLSEAATLGFHKAVLSEFLGTAILIISGCGSVVTMDEGRPVSTLTSALTFGMTVAMIVWTFNHLSGAHINPCVTLSFLVTGHLTVIKSIAFILAQCAGAIGGAAVIWEMTPPTWRGTLGSTVFADDVTLVQGFFIEFVSTFILLLGVFACSDRLRNDHGGSMPLTVGLIVFMQSSWAVYWVAPTLGALSGALLYHHVLAVTSAETEPTPTNHFQFDKEVEAEATKQGADSPAFEPKK
ncbi:aquaporin [Elysia marginata]|uniref:Aquaporin n=1 Tax=Elysia marginata TaxID=1093978 RepID=A0AAV4I377_9GAST|nr:aquaporin [Elysia marginata]